MPAPKTRTVDLAAAEAAYVEEKIASGAYASASEVVAAGLEALRDRDVAFERWLREDVAAAYDEAMAHPEDLLSVETVFAELRAHHARRSGEKM